MWRTELLNVVTGIFFSLACGVIAHDIVLRIGGF